MPISVERFANGAAVFKRNFAILSVEAVREVGGLLADTELAAEAEHLETTVQCSRDEGNLFISCAGDRWFVSLQDGATGEWQEYAPGADMESVVIVSMGGVDTPMPLGAVLDQETALPVFEGFALRASVEGPWRPTSGLGAT